MRVLLEVLKKTFTIPIINPLSWFMMSMLVRVLLCSKTGSELLQYLFCSYLFLIVGVLRQGNGTSEQWTPDDPNDNYVNKYNHQQYCNGSLSDGWG